MTQSAPVTAIVVGAGNRGTGYARYAQIHPDRFKIVGVAEPLEDRRKFMQETYQIPDENVFMDWQELATKPRLADMVIISTQDAMHMAPALAFAELKYSILLEKPMAPNESDCEQIVRAVKENGNLFGVCHVLRYTPFTQTLKRLLDEGVVGEIVSIQVLEPVGFWHQAHSFVRGNWRNEKESSPMLLAKSCHDLDWIRYIMGKPCLSVSSFGSLKHFRKDQKPAGAGSALRCLDCAYEAQCPYSAKRIYGFFLEKVGTGWPLNVLTLEPNLETITEALRTGPYGRCVYECDNDVVDHQIVNMQFKNDLTASFTMTAFTQAAPRKIRIFGTLGEIETDSLSIQIYDFLSNSTRTVTVDESTSGHGGGDFGLLDHFVAAVAQNDPSLILSGPDESLETHRMVFASEQARHEHKVVDL